MRANAEVNVAPVSAIRMSQTRARSRPNPAVVPRSSATTGSGHRAIASTADWKSLRPALQQGSGGIAPSQRSQWRSSPGTEVPAGPAQHHHAGRAALLDQVQLPRDLAGELGGQSVAPGRPVEGQPVDGTVFTGQQLVGHEALGWAGPSTFGTGGEGGIIRSPCSSFESTSDLDRHPAARPHAARGPVADRRRCRGTTRRAPVARVHAVLVDRGHSVLPPLVAGQREAARLDPLLLRLGGAGRRLDRRGADCLAPSPGLVHRLPLGDPLRRPAARPVPALRVLDGPGDQHGRVTRSGPCR